MHSSVKENVDTLLLEQGEYVPVELLLMQGRLLHTDYFKWLNGEVDYLENVLFGNQQEILNLLIEAQRYVEKIPNLTSQQKNYNFYREKTAISLNISESTLLKNLICTRFSKHRDAVQMDLFLDSTATILVNDIVEALLKNDSGKARRQLEKLYDTEPSHTKLGMLEQLVAAQESLLTPVTNVEREIDTLVEINTPIADAIFLSQSRFYLDFHWQRLTKALGTHPWDASNPHMHTSYTAMKSRDWETVINAIESTPQWRNNSTLLLRYAQACTQTRKAGEALSAWFLLCWHFADHIRPIESDADWEIRQLWKTFLELDPELETGDFPAWVILVKPAMHKLLISNCLPPLPYELMLKLVLQDSTTQSLPNSSAIQLRAQLKQDHPDLFMHYLNHRGN